MSAYTYKCRECGAEFDEPHQWVERHGLTCGPFERWSACPNCKSTDYDYSHIVQSELELQDDEEVDEEEC